MIFKNYTAWLWCIALSLNLGMVCPAAMAEDKTVLHGTVQQEGIVLPQTDNFGGTGPSLSRKDIKRLGDPFGSDTTPGPSADDSAVLDAPDQAFKGVAQPPRADKKNFGLGAQEDNFQGTSMPARSDALSVKPPPVLEGAAADSPGTDPGSGAANDPDSWLALEWDAWHRRVAQSIYQKWIFFANAAFKNDPTPMLTRVSYVVTREGRIENVKFLERSPNVMFDSLTAQVIKSFNGDQETLRFPEGSRRSSIENFGVFSQNQHTGQGFRYTTGDKETIHRR